jgi:hypothetical protein
MRFTVTLSDKYASGEASQDNWEAYLSFCKSNDTFPRTSFTVYNNVELKEVTIFGICQQLRQGGGGSERCFFKTETKFPDWDPNPVLYKLSTTFYNPRLIYNGSVKMFLPFFCYFDGIVLCTFFIRHPKLSST